jgi:hypothetical protein
MRDSLAFDFAIMRLGRREIPMRNPDAQLELARSTKRSLIAGVQTVGENR